MTDHAAVLLSGGIDSSALCAWQRPHIAFFVNYGQVCADAERQAAQQISDELGIDLCEISIECADMGSGDLANRAPSPLAPASDWWPYRNQLLVTAAAMRAVELGVTDLMLGTVESDTYHADGTAAFINAMDRLLALQEGHLRLSAPALELTSVELVKRSQIEFPVLCWAHSCHKASVACGACRGCNKHREVMAGLGYDPF